MHSVLRQFFLFLCFLAPLIVSCGRLPEESKTVNGGHSKDMIDAGSKEIISINKPVVVPPGYDTRPNIDNPLDVGNPDMAFSKNMKGLNLKTLFSEDIKDTDDRFERLEEAFIAFRREYEEVRPAIMRLASIESDIQAILGDFEALVKSHGTAFMAEAMPFENAIEGEIFGPKNLPVLLKEETGAPEIASSAIDVPGVLKKSDKLSNSTNAKIQNIRIGLHSNKERIVVQLSDKSIYAVDLDNEEKILLVHFEGLSELPTNILMNIATKSYVVSSYNFSKSEKGIDLILQLKKSTKVLSTEWLDPTMDNPSHRLVIDLKN